MTAIGAGAGSAGWQMTPVVLADTAEVAEHIAPTLQGAPILALKLETRTDFTEESLRQFTGIRTGQPYDARAVRQSLDRLYETGLFSNVIVDATIGVRGVVLTYRLLPKQWIRQLTIAGEQLSIKPRILRQHLQLTVGDEFSQEHWQAALARLIRFYAQEGFFEARLTPTVVLQEDQTSVHLDISVSEGQPALVEQLTLTGTLGMSEATIRGMLKLKPGQRYSALELDERLEALWRKYVDEEFLLATVGSPSIRYLPSTNRVAITISIDAGPRVDVQFAGNPYWFEKTLRAQLLIHEELSLDEDVLAASASRLKNLLRDDGYLTATVDVSLTTVENGRQAIVAFDIVAGPRFQLHRLHFTGNQVIETSVLRSQFEVRPRLFGLIHPLFDPAQWNKDLKALQRYYATQGFISVQIEVQTQLIPEDGDVDATIMIDEGPQARIARIEFSGNAHVPDAVLRRALTVRTRAPYDPTQARADRLALAALYAGKGYLDADLAIEPTLNDAGTEVSLRFVITEGEPTFVGRIFLEGNQQTGEAVIRRELLIHAGDPYDYGKILRSRHRISRLGIFRDVRLEPLATEQPSAIRDLQLSVTERPARAVEFGIGVAAREGVRAFAQISHKNLAGTGRRITLRAQADFLEQRYSVNYVEPWLAGFPIDLRLTGLLEVEEEVTFDRTTHGATAGFEKNITDTLIVSFLYRFTKNRFSNLVTELSDEELERVNIGSVTTALILDTRDDFFNPHRGSISSLAFEDAAFSLGSQVQFVKLTASSSWFFSPHRNIVLAFSGRTGFARQFGVTELVPLSERFYLGGRSTVRGYAEETLGVLHLTPEKDADDTSTLSANGQPTGGDAMVLTNIEVRIALPRNLGLVLFLDGGQVWTKLKTVRIDEMKFSTGAGIRYNTPVGPLRLDWGYKLTRDTFIDAGTSFQEKPHEFHFTLGHAF